ncbi:MAG TPA: nuclear transport factor 2 family protein [Steroidobacteraceae bacterium]|nr:nuclear transport factor 2 family protein [Steroidobacteraceae bacterium]
MSIPFGALTPEEAAALRVLEERLSMPALTESRQSLSELLAAEFEEFGSSGRLFGRHAVLDALVPGGRPPIVLEGFTAVRIAVDTVLVRYVSRPGEAPVQSGAVLKPPARRSSLWVWRSGRWQLLFHQGTLLPAL